jgi:fusarinine C synthase
MNDRDAAQIWTWNHEVPPTIERCMHEIIRDRVRVDADRVAVKSWDGVFTYGQIDQLSDKLALHLRELGLPTGSIVPLCFEKSKWTLVAVLAVMKAGGCFALTDPSQPEARLQTIVEQTDALIFITSQQQSELGARIAPQSQVVVVSESAFTSITTAQLSERLPDVAASSPMYVIFTSGSTGKPKGVMISHANYTSGAVPRADAVGYRSHSRVFDFASYAFDVSIDCMLCTLANGGCLCIPTDEKRMNDLSGAIRDSKANMAHMTPSVARVLDADIIPSLEVIGLGGEAVSAGDAATWGKTTSVVIAYGPSECTVGCTINNKVNKSPNIGKGVGGLTWIVDPNNHDRLMPIGAVGELLIEGPVVGIGYLNEPEKTAQAFIEDPKWLISGGGSCSGRHGRLYKTGDLVKYDANGSGSIAFVGRKDQQVKLRGQRVELAEVEHHLRSRFPAGVTVVAEVIKPGDGDPTLVAFLVETSRDGDTSSSGGETVSPSPDLSAAILYIEQNLGTEIPRYMVPSAFIALVEMPSLVSGKIDRKRLREIGASMTREQIARMRTAVEKRRPQTEMERLLQGLWMKVLGATEIALEDSFFILGGDSLRAMRLVAAAREEGVLLSVANIFQNPTLEGMAMTAEQISGVDTPSISAFSLLGTAWDPEEAKREVAKLCAIGESSIEDIYPCTPLQEGLMALSAKVKDAYIAQRVAELADLETAQRLRNAFDAAAKECAIIRTRIVQVPGQGLMQVVIVDEIQWHSGESLRSYLKKDQDESMELGRPLVRCALIHENGKVHFVLTMHHALYDGWSMPLVVDRINRAYTGQAMNRRASFTNFIQYLQGMDTKGASGYWRSLLDGATGPQFPPLPFPGYQARADSLLEHYVTLPTRPPSTTTAATVVRGAWALVASLYSASGDVVFGETLMGRNAPIVGAEEIEGPMITTVPVRIQVSRQARVADFLQDIHNQGVRQIPYEHTGLQHIRKLSPDALEACELRTGLVLHPRAQGDAHEDDLPASQLVPAGDAEAAQEALKFNTYPLMLVCSLDANGFLIMASFDSNCVDRVVMEKVLVRLEHAAQHLCQNGDATVGGINLLEETEEEELAALGQSFASSLNESYAGVLGGWVVSPNNPTQLVPRGSVGELIVSTRGTLELTPIPTPIWLQMRQESERPRFYRTRKLVKIAADGNITFIKQIINAVPSYTQQKDRHISAYSSKQRSLQKLWSRVLHVSEDSIGLNDSFFQLGGDSIAAMKLVSEARLDGLRLTVTQIFQNRTLYDMAKVVQVSETATTESRPDKPFRFIDVPDSAEYIARVIQPKLSDHGWSVTDVFPARPLQEIAAKGTTQLPRYSVRYEAMYFDGDVDKVRLFNSCQEVVSRNEILRTVFLEIDGNCFNIVLENVTTVVEEFEVDVDVEGFTKQLCNVDVYAKMALGSSFVKWFFVRGRDGKSCLILRISHAQYDEICLPLCLRQLSALYEGREVQDTLPFSSFVRHVVQRSIPNSIDYWQKLLEGASMSILMPDIEVESKRHFAVHKTFDISARSKDVTVATLPTAAWALCLARRLAVQDVTFGEVVSGRNNDFPNCDNVMGPCWQYVPVRVAFQPGWAGIDLLHLIQHQHIASSVHEGMGLAEVVRDCTDWPASVDWFDSVVHQDVAHVETLDFFATSGRMETIYPHEEPLREWKIQAFVKGDEIILEIVTVESWGEYARGLLDDLGEALEALVNRPWERLFDGV